MIPARFPSAEQSRTAPSTCRLAEMRTPRAAARSRLSAHSVSDKKKVKRREETEAPCAPRAPATSRAELQDARCATEGGGGGCVCVIVTGAAD